MSIRDIRIKREKKNREMEKFYNKMERTSFYFYVLRKMC